MSHHLFDEKVDSYAPPGGDILDGGATGGVLGSDTEHASRVGSRVMSHHLFDEKVDSYAPPGGDILDGGATGGVLGSDTEHASRVG
ncbi:hypothetical protein JCGZ_06432 [Jatropha curcas]|uniref:Uncharacterized protein n=1 Tax=Jatropha curcas TaxID=180498 RepID=A0A067KNH9_JATCU|nr:hypothetical protein JCGZ_06432 [Jatropha curcas]